MLSLSGMFALAAPAQAAAPANDNFANAQREPVTFSDVTSNVDASVEAGEPGASCGLSA
ncbi:hypothetical protein ABZ721_10630 [Streptomyces sp. NPDC006733]|uniref:hypothetical protein n=1 Tax=Streptomyces sp. NPDC006733 TaxID=3155460 RepID=UPI0033EC3A92